MPEDADIIIIGAGPAGLSAAITLAKQDIRVLVIERESAGKEKVCGGGLGRRSIRLLDELTNNSFDYSKGNRINKLLVGAPDGSDLSLDFSGNKSLITGLTIVRGMLEDEMVRSINDNRNFTIRYDCEATKWKYTDNGVEVETNLGLFSAKALVIAAGAHPTREIEPDGYSPFNRESDAIALRAYFKNVDQNGNHDQIEFYFFKDVFPGYFWIFPQKESICNVGVYLPLRYKHQKGVNLQSLFYELIQEQSTLAGRFQNASLIGKIESSVLPLHKEKRVLSGDRFLVVGDSASLVDDLAGEGIGNALQSGIWAGEVLHNAFNNNDFSVESLRKYDLIINRKLVKELNWHARLMRFVGTKPRLFSLLVRKFSTSLSLNVSANKLATGASFKRLLFSSNFWFQVLFSKW